MSCLTCAASSPHSSPGEQDVYPVAEPLPLPRRHERVRERLRPEHVAHQAEPPADYLVGAAHDWLLGST
eukprot:10537154-Heterocapsa_arctica.AAC.1